MRKVLMLLAVLSWATVVHAQTPTFPVGRPLTLEWDARPATENIVRYEAQLDATGWVGVGLSLSWSMPLAQLTVGNHSAAVRACNTEAISQQIQCGPEGVIAFAIAVPTSLPGAPVPRIVPQDQALVGNEPRFLADAFSYVIRLKTLTGAELNALQAAYDGPIPVTYLSAITFLQRMALTLALLE